MSHKDIFIDKIDKKLGKGCHIILNNKIIKTRMDKIKKENTQYRMYHFMESSHFMFYVY